MYSTYNLDSGEPDKIRLRDERSRLIVTAAAKQLKAVESTSGLAADVKAFMATFASPGRRRDVEDQMAHWIDALGADRNRHSITSMEISTPGFAKWASTMSDSTRKQLRQVLGQLYRTLDGKTARNPVADVPAIAVFYDAPRSMPYVLLRDILEAMGDSQSAAVAHVQSYTGLPPAQIRRLHESHFDLEAGTVQVKARRKGGGAPAKKFKLIPEALDAFKRFDKWDLWGKQFSASSYAKAWRRAEVTTKAAWKKAGKRWPIDFKPRAYDQRHSFAVEILNVTKGNYHALNQLLQHATMNQTLRYAQGAVTETVEVAIATAAVAVGGFGRTTSAPKTPTNSPTNSAQTRAKRSTLLHVVSVRK